MQAELERVKRERAELEAKLEEARMVGLAATMPAPSTPGGRRVSVPSEVGSAGGEPDGGEQDDWLTDFFKSAIPKLKLKELTAYVSRFDNAGWNSLEMMEVRCFWRVLCARGA